MEKNYKNIDIGYELWDRGYILRNCSTDHEVKVYNLYVALYDKGYVHSVDDFIEYLKDTNLFYNVAEENEKYRRENEPKIREYFAKYIEGRTFNNIDPQDWDFYSDWHKDVFGYRPHGIVCGEYINPHR